MEQSLAHYHQVLKTDSTCIEAIACIATHHFYDDQPEIALRYYRLEIFISPFSLFFLFYLFSFITTWLSLQATAADGSV